MVSYQAQKVREEIAPIPSIAKVGDLELRVVGNLPHNFTLDKVPEVDPMLIEALKLTYQVYINEKGYIPSDNLRPEEQSSQMMWNEFDSDPDTTQIVGVRNNEVICRFRLSDGKCPLDDYFNLSRFNTMPIRESSRFIVKGNLRGGGRVFRNLAAYEAFVSKPLGQVFWTGLHDSSGLYEKAGAQTIAAYHYDEFPNHPGMATFQRWDLDNLEEIAEKSDKASLKFVQGILTTPVNIIRH